MIPFAPVPGEDIPPVVGLLLQISDEGLSLEEREFKLSDSLGLIASTIEARRRVLENDPFGTTGDSNLNIYTFPNGIERQNLQYKLDKDRTTVGWALCGPRERFFYTEMEICVCKDDSGLSGVMYCVRKDYVYNKADSWIPPKYNYSYTDSSGRVYLVKGTSTARIPAFIEYESSFGKPVDPSRLVNGLLTLYPKVDGYSHPPIP